ncbi:AmpG family muropeptide MFS transporter [Kordiimonas lacus]|uniref:MFS transporter, PAT family, beta-lactamase induction signal transducer AmpG n=1 Tax=Kordiimonas lacus TaxID=637679 RepID=A0A1G6T6W8_9PROT|nr:MFS transporter [Kordiimonas lacus]SDD24759.1 MFS transporter, PAT family, beta-lactamase induction signal transducer AmpG [Kordiimonas lacus]
MTETAEEQALPIGQRIGRLFLTFFKKPLLGAFLLGMTSGFPLTIILGIMTTWLREYEIDKSTIGIFTWATLPYALKVLWAPLLDRLKLGTLSSRFGRRRSWILIVCAAMALAIWSMSQLTPESHLVAIGTLSVTIGFLSASLDILVDAYRIEVTEEKDLAHSAGMYQWGYRFANLIAGAGVFLVADQLGWSFALSLLPILVLPGLLAILWLGEPKVFEDDFLREERARHSHLSPYQLQVYEAVILPFKEFILRPHWQWILLFIVLVKFGDVMASVMTGPFLVDLGFTLTEMAIANKTVGAIAAAAGGGAGIFVWWWFDTFKALLISVIFMMVTNLGFVALSVIGADTTALAITVGLENFATGAGGTVMIAYFGSLCNLSFTATQYALLSMLSGLARGFFGGFTGIAADALSWTQFFLVSTVMAGPGLIALLILWKKDIRARNLENVTQKGDI